jgi:glycosyltransferase involved in cell wall biosynthesis
MRETVWYISKYATPLKYGIGSRHFFLARELERLGHRTVVIASDSNHLVEIPSFESMYAKELVDGVETWWIKTLKYGGSESAGRVLSWIDFEIKLLLMPKGRLPRPDVIIASSLSLLTVLSGYVLKKRFGSRLLFEVRDIWPLTLTEVGTYKRWNPLVKMLGMVERFGYRNSDAVVGTMPNLTEHVRRVAGSGPVCRCVPQGLDRYMLDQSEPLPEGYEAKFVPKGKFVVGYVGTIGTANALQTMIQCAAELIDNPAIHFLLVGDGGRLTELKALAAGLGNVTFAPKLKRQQVQSFLQHCDVLYLGTLKNEIWRYGQSLNKLIDYMYAGKPIIASYSGYPSMINEAQCGVFVPAEDVGALKEAILTYAAKPREELREIGERGRRWLLENRTWDKLAAEFVKLF